MKLVILAAIASTATAFSVGKVSLHQRRHDWDEEFKITSI